LGEEAPYARLFVGLEEEAWGPASVIAGKYRLVSKLGQGGMGAVWRADHLTLKAPVAIKLLDPSIAKTEEGLTRFLREAQAAAALRSSHVVQTFDYGVNDGVPYIVMELLVGQSLAERLTTSGPLEPVALAALLKQVARAISKAHQAGIIHRDLKPDNIFLVEGEEDEAIAKVLDFGIAKAAGELGVALESKTRTGALLGTPFYMSPEQAQGTSVLDFRSDLWSLAVITFEALLGKRPFESEALGDLLLKICANPLPVPSKLGPVPAGFDAWFAKACNREPSQRFESAAEMAKAFERLLVPGRPLGVTFDSISVVAPIDGVSSAGDSLEGTEFAAPSAAARRPFFVAGAALVVAVAVIVLVLVTRGREHPTAESVEASQKAAAHAAAAVPKTPEPIAPASQAPPAEGVPAAPAASEQAGAAAEHVVDVDVDEPTPAAAKRPAAGHAKSGTSKPAAKKTESYDPLMQRR
jgi:hypothetical protein